MTQTRTLVAFGLAISVLAAPSLANAQGRQRQATGRAVPRTGPPPRTVVRTYGPAYRPAYRSYYYSPYYYSPFGGYYGPWAAGYGFGYPGYAYAGYGYPAYRYGYGYGGYPYGARYRPYGGVRIDLPQREAEVLVDGYYAGTVDDFDGAFQQLNLEPGPHRIEIRAPGFTPVSFEVNIEPGRTITYRSALRP
jgi:hypothetical protein